MEIYPSKYDQLELSVNERSFLRTINRAFENEGFAYFVLHINPRKIAMNNGAAELFNLFVYSDGLFLFRFIETKDVKTALLTISLTSRDDVYGRIENDIYSKLAISRYLLDSSGRLAFAFNICYVFPEIGKDDILSSLSPKEKPFVEKHVLFKDDIQRIRNEGSIILKHLIDRRNFIEEKILNNIFQRLCPEITIARKFLLDGNETTSTGDEGLDGSERSVVSYRLDASQINIINKIRKGDLLILACAGSGKSVLLISKCFKLASLNPNEEFLITCYNRNLNNYYQWAIAQAGFLNKNVRCQTFFSLIISLLDRNHISKPQSHYNDPEDYYDELFKIANDALAQGRIKERFTGIFIDEIQIFKPQWYRFCFNLLKNKSPEHHFLL